jgi:hypothetical protein
MPNVRVSTSEMDIHQLRALTLLGGHRTMEAHRTRAKTLQAVPQARVLTTTPVILILRLVERLMCANEILDVTFDRVIARRHESLSDN